MPSSIHFTSNSNLNNSQFVSSSHFDDIPFEVTWNEILYDGGLAAWVPRSSFRWLTICVCLIGVLGKLLLLLLLFLFISMTRINLPREYLSGLYVTSTLYAYTFYVCIFNSIMSIEYTNIDFGNYLRSRCLCSTELFELFSGNNFQSICFNNICLINMDYRLFYHRSIYYDLFSIHWRK